MNAPGAMSAPGVTNALDVQPATNAAVAQSKKTTHHASMHHASSQHASSHHASMQHASSQPTPQTFIPETAAHMWTPSQFKPTPSSVRQARELKDEPTETSANEANKKRNVREYTLGEEIANSVTHGIGAALSIAAIPILVVAAVHAGGGLYLFAALMYTITMLLEYLMSTLYHAIAVDKAKRVFKVLDHSCIYLFIAGTYTPFCLITLHDFGGVPLFFAVWALAILGVVFEAFWVFRPRWISALLYLALGWCIVMFLPTLVAVLPAGGLWLLVAGGICYTVGCIFYVLKKIPYMHSVFHLFVVAGSVLQFLAVLLYVM